MRYIILIIFFPFFNVFSQRFNQPASQSSNVPKADYYISSHISKSDFNSFQVPYKRLNFNYELTDFKVDTLFDRIYAIKDCGNMCGMYTEGKLFVFKAPEYKIEKILHSSLAFSYEINDSLLFVNFLKESSDIAILNRKDLKEVFYQKAKIFFFYWEHYNKKHNIAIVRYGIPPKNTTIKAIDLTTGKDLWKTVIEDYTRWDHCYYVNDSIFIVNSNVNGFKCINIKKGVVWTHELDGDYEYEGTVIRSSFGNAMVAGAVGGMFGLVGGVVAYAIISNTPVSGSVPDARNMAGSDSLIGSAGIFTASKDKLQKLNLIGDVKWEKSIDENTRSKTFLIRKNKLVILINSGYVIKKGILKQQGEPYMVAYNTNDGKLNYLKAFDKKAMINDLFFIKDTLVLVSSNKLFRFRFAQNISLIDSLVFKRNSKFWIGNNLAFERKDTNHVAPINTGKELYIGQTGLDSLIFIDHKLEFKKSFALKTTSFKVFEDEKYFYTTKNYSKLYIIDKKDLTIKNSIDFSSDFLFCRQFLYVKYPNSISVYDRKALLGEF